MDQNSKSGGAEISASTALPGRRLATSKNPRMLTPSEIDLLREDLRAALKRLGQHKSDDAHALLRDYGFRPEEFEIIQRADPSSPYQNSITGTVTLVRKRNRTAKIYAATGGTSWLEQFEADLKSVAFGSP